MERAVDIAAYMISAYKELTGEKMTELELHKLLYFTQREGFALWNRSVISDPFQGWKHGPVCVQVRSAFDDGSITVKTEEISAETKYLVNNVLSQYGGMAAWVLRNLSHEEISWKNSRKGLRDDEPGNVELLNSDIQIDALKVRPYDHLWDMYYDEFEDAEKEVAMA